MASGVCKNELVHKILRMEETVSTCFAISGRKDDFVSVNALRKFAEKINHRGITSCEYVYLPGTRHETYCSDDRTMEMYLDKIMKFLDSCSGEMFSHYEVLRE